MADKAKLTHYLEGIDSNADNWYKIRVDGKVVGRIYLLGPTRGGQWTCWREPEKGQKATERDLLATKKGWGECIAFFKKVHNAE